MCSRLGDKIYHHYHGLLTSHMQNPKADEAVFRASVAQQVGTNKELKNLVFRVEMLVFKEIQGQI